MSFSIPIGIPQRDISVIVKTILLRAREQIENRIKYLSTEGNYLSVSVLDELRQERWTFQRIGYSTCLQTVAGLKSILVALLGHHYD